jgi:hypothetical protein
MPPAKSTDAQKEKMESVILASALQDLAMIAVSHPSNTVSDTKTVALEE